MGILIWPAASRTGTRREHDGGRHLHPGRASGTAPPPPATRIRTARARRPRARCRGACWIAAFRGATRRCRILDLQSEPALGGLAHRGLKQLRQLLQRSRSYPAAARARASAPRAGSCARASTAAGSAAPSSTDRVPDTAARPRPSMLSSVFCSRISCGWICMSKRRAVSNSRSSTWAKEISFNGLLKMGSQTVRTADSSSSTRACPAAPSRTRCAAPRRARSRGRRRPGNSRRGNAGRAAASVPTMPKSTAA